MNFSPDYIVGGKTGTAEIADLQKGGYKKNIFNGTYVGFVGGDKHGTPIKNEFVYTGSFVSGKREGKGRIVFALGDIYEG